MSLNILPSEHEFETAKKNIKKLGGKISKDPLTKGDLTKAMKYLFYFICVCWIAITLLMIITAPFWYFIYWIMG